MIEFWRTDPGAVLDRMATLAASARGWLNLRPDVVEDDDVPPPGPLAFLAPPGPAVPLCTWSPGERHRRRTEPPSIGVQHRTGTKAAARLADAGHAVPPGWRVSQDHPRRGLVVEPGAGESHERVLDWLLDAGEALSLLRPTGRWQAAVFGTP